jgi:hypothetical protein
VRNSPFFDPMMQTSFAPTSTRCASAQRWSRRYSAALGPHAPAWRMFAAGGSRKKRFSDEVQGLTQQDIVRQFLMTLPHRSRYPAAPSCRQLHARR